MARNSKGKGSIRRQTVRPGQPSITLDGTEDTGHSKSINPKGKSGFRDRDRPPAERLTEATAHRLLEAKPPEGASRQVRRNLERSQAKVRAAIERKERGNG